MDTACGIDSLHDGGDEVPPPVTVDEVREPALGVWRRSSNSARGAARRQGHGLWPQPVHGRRGTLSVEIRPFPGRTWKPLPGAVGVEGKVLVRDGSFFIAMLRFRENATFTSIRASGTRS